jgi:hypothetical protein
MKAKKYPLVIVVWNDAFNMSNDWHELEGIPVGKTFTVKSVGFVFHEDSNSITLIPHLHLSEDGAKNGCGTGVMVIPKGMIVSRKKL